MSEKIGTLHLHIGIHKTGTTSLQQFLYLNRLRLRELGFLYPTDPTYFWQGELSHSFLAHSLRPSRPHYLPPAARYSKESSFGSLARDHTLSPELDVIISSEHFSLFYAQQDVELLAEHFLSIFRNVRVYIYVRQQAEAIEANYKQGVRSKAFAMGFHSYVKEALTTQFQRWEYYGMVNQYGRAFGEKNVIVRLYD